MLHFPADLPCRQLLDGQALGPWHFARKQHESAPPLLLPFCYAHRLPVALVHLVYKLFHRTMTDLTKGEICDQVADIGIIKECAKALIEKHGPMPLCSVENSVNKVIQEQRVIN